MRRITSRIIGYKRFKNKLKRPDSHPADKSYESAYFLSGYLDKHRELFTDDSDLIIYPYAWGEDFFVVLFRHKDGLTEPCEFNLGVAQSLMGEVIHEDEWLLKSDGVDNVTPYYFKFYSGEVK